MTNSTQTQPVVKQPWYVLFVTGVLLTGFVAWALVIRALYDAGKRRMAYGLIAINAVIGIALFFGGMTIRLEWWKTELLVMFMDIAWTIAAIAVYQRLPGRVMSLFHVFAWKKMLVPLASAAILGFCLGVTMAIPLAMTQHGALEQSEDILDRTSILWFFLVNGLKGVPYGLFAGIWWASSAVRFRPSTIVATLCGMGLSLLISVAFVSGTAMLFYHSGFHGHAGSVPAIAVSPWMHGVPRTLTTTSLVLGSFAIIIMGLFFSTASSFRQFWARAVIPLLACLGSLPYWNMDDTLSRLGQKHLIYNLSNPKPKERARAHRQLEVLLDRYPDHDLWCRLASEHAEYLYDIHACDAAKRLWRRIASKYRSEPRYALYTAQAQSAIESPEFGLSPDTMRIAMPMVDWESYLDPNWMVLVAIMHYWEHSAASESKTKMRLRSLSRSDESIALKHMPGLIDLDDAARSLGYQVAILPAQAPVMQALLRDSIPIIYPVFKALSITYGYDKGRSRLFTYRFSRISTTLRGKARKETEVILAQKSEGEGKSAERLGRIALESSINMDLALPGSLRGKLTEPLMAIVYPDRMSDSVAVILGISREKLDQTTSGFRAAMISLSYFDRANPAESFEWALTAHRLIPDPLPRYAAYLAARAWQIRKTFSLNRLALEHSLPELAFPDSIFKNPLARQFLDSCQSLFITDRNQGLLPAIISDRYLSTLILSSEADRSIGYQLTEKELSYAPLSQERWQWLLKYAGWQTAPYMRAALYRQYVSYHPYDYGIKVRLATELIANGEYTAADSMLNQVVADSVHTDADFYYCSAALSQNKGKNRKALQLYKRCTSMRRYKPDYFLRYSKLLKSMGHSAEAERMESWANKIMTDSLLTFSRVSDPDTAAPK